MIALAVCERDIGEVANAEIISAFGVASNVATMTEVIEAVAREMLMAVVKTSNASPVELNYSADVIDAIHHIAALKPVSAPEGEAEFLAWLHSDQR